MLVIRRCCLIYFSLIFSLSSLGISVRTRQYFFRSQDAHLLLPFSPQPHRFAPLHRQFSIQKINVPRRVTNLLIPTPLPRPVPNKKNELGQQLHQVEIRSGGVIAYRVPLHQKMVVGALSGVIGMSTVFPIDLVKTRLQVLSKATATAGSGGASAGISYVCRDVYARQGVAGFYRGLGATAVMIAPEKAIKLGVNDYLRDVFCDYDRTRETVAPQVAAEECLLVCRLLKCMYKFICNYLY